jgi:hypothetical protein
LQPLRSFPAIYGTRRFITAFTRAFHLYLTCARQIQSTTPNPISNRSILMLSIHLRLGLPSGLFPSGFSTNNLYTYLFSPIRATCPAHLILLDFKILIILDEEYKSCNSSLCSFLHPPVTPSHFGPNILLRPIKVCLTTILYILYHVQISGNTIDNLFFCVNSLKSHYY